MGHNLSADAGLHIGAFLSRSDLPAAARVNAATATWSRSVASDARVWLAARPPHAEFINVRWFDIAPGVPELKLNARRLGLANFSMWAAPREHPASRFGETSIKVARYCIATYPEHLAINFSDEGGVADALVGLMSRGGRTAMVEAFASAWALASHWVPSESDIGYLTHTAITTGDVDLVKFMLTTITKTTGVVVAACPDTLEALCSAPGSTLVAMVSYVTQQMFVDYDAIFDIPVNGHASAFDTLTEEPKPRDLYILTALFQHAYREHYKKDNYLALCDAAYDMPHSGYVGACEICVKIGIILRAEIQRVLSGG